MAVCQTGGGKAMGFLPFFVAHFSAIPNTTWYQVVTSSSPHRTNDWLDWPTAFSTPSTLPYMLPCGLGISDKAGSDSGKWQGGCVK